MKLKNNIVIDSEIEITFNSFNPTAGRLAACLLGFSIQVQIKTPTELTLTHRGTQPRPPHRVCSAAAARRRRPAGPGHAHASGERRAGGDRLDGYRLDGTAEVQSGRSLDRRRKRKRHARWATQFSLLQYI